MVQVTGYTLSIVTPLEHLLKHLPSDATHQPDCNEITARSNSVNSRRRKINIKHLTTSNSNQLSYAKLVETCGDVIKLEQRV